MSHGAGRWVNASNDNNGSVYASCKNGSINTSSGSCTSSSRTFYNRTDKSGQALAANPGNRASFCQAQGMNVVGNGQQSDFGGNDIPHCYSADSSRVV